MEKKLLMQVEFRGKKYTGSITYNDSEYFKESGRRADKQASDHLEAALAGRIYKEFEMGDIDPLSRESRMFDEEVEKALEAKRTKIKNLEL